jgi:hypothetical protein
MLCSMKHKAMQNLLVAVALIGLCRLAGAGLEGEMKATLQILASILLGCALVAAGLVVVGWIFQR